MKRIKAGKTFHVYSDGACNVHNGKTGSWGYVIIDSHTENILFEDSGIVKKTSSPVMELKAAVEGMAKAWESLPQGHVVLFSDCKFVVNGITDWVHGWKKNKWVNGQGKPVKSQQMWMDLVKLQEIMSPEIIWIKGHSGNKWNDYVDKLCQKTLKTK